jgi:predicted site-specific integrase-resolvase
MRAKEVMKTLGICRRTLARYVKSGLIKIDITVNGQHRYNADSVYALLGKTVKNDDI